MYFPTSWSLAASSPLILPSPRSPRATDTSCLPSNSRRLRDQPFVDPVGKQQHFDAALAEDLEVRAVARGEEGLRGDVVDALLSLLHASDIVGERDRLGFGIVVRGGKAKQLCDLRLVRRVLAHAFLEHAPELGPEPGVLVLVAGELLQQAEHPLRAAGADRVDVAAVLQDLARHVERQVGRVDHAAHEAQVGRQEVLGVVHDEDAPHVELEAVALLPVPEVERRLRREVEELRVLLAALDPVVRPGERRLEVVRDVLVELDVLLVLDLALGPRPQRARLVDRSPRPSAPEWRCGRNTCARCSSGGTRPAARPRLRAGAGSLRCRGGLLRGLDGVLARAFRHVAFPAHRLACGHARRGA